MKSLIFLLSTFIFVSNSLARGSFKTEVLSTSTNYNYFAIPNPNVGGRIDTSQGKSIFAYRLFYEKDFGSWSWTLLYAPLEADYSFNATKNFEFNNTNFTLGQATTIDYKFNSYRLGFRKIHGSAGRRFFYGGLIKVRDAEICVNQASGSSCYDNVGFVPLLNLGFDLSGDLLFLSANIDGLFSSRGSAYDANVEVGVKLNSFTLGMGARMLGGGADNEKVLNFAQFQSYYLSITM